MRHDKLELQLDLLLFLADGRGHTVDEMCRRLGLSRRNVYYYLEFFRDCGFVLDKTGTRYRIDRSSPFFRRVVEQTSFTEEEVLLLKRLLDRVDQHNAVLENLREKLARFYDHQILNGGEMAERSAHVIGRLHEAIKLQQMAVLRGYTSPHGRTSRDRLVEPYLLMNGNQEVRCYEPASQMNKTFKVARMADVEVLADGWKFASRHRAMYTDVFMFSAEEQTMVELRLGTLAYSILREEYPASRPLLQPDGKDSWRVLLPVSSFVGVGRFVLGLFEDIEVVGPEAFRHYLARKAQALGARFPS